MVWCAVFNVLLAIVGRQFSTPFDQTIKSRVFAKMALSYISAMFCSNTAIFYTSYPTQVLPAYQITEPPTMRAVSALTDNVCSVQCLLCRVMRSLRNANTHMLSV